MRFGRTVLTIPLFQVKSSNCEPLWGDGRKEKISFDEKKNIFDILSFSDFAFSRNCGFPTIEFFQSFEK